MDWVCASNCADVDPEVFFDEQDPGPAKAVCRGCKAWDECWEYTEMVEQNYGKQLGVWAGMTPAERQRHRHGGHNYLRVSG